MCSARWESISVVSSTAYIADIIEHEVDWARINRMLSQKVDNLRIQEYQVAAHSKATGKLVIELNLPGGVILASLIREKEAIAPNGQTRIITGDTIIAMGGEDSIRLLGAYFTEDVL